MAAIDRPPAGGTSEDPSELECTIGLGGAIAILLAGLLATLSSANASLLSSSRTVYALARHKLVPRKAGAVNLRFGTPTSR